MKEQYVCTVCGYNMVDSCPEHCPFCRAARENFLTAEEVTRNFKVESTKVTDKITMLRSRPPLGYEHAAYRIETPGRIYWIDCPSTFDPGLGPVDRICYTHHHFLGAGNLYRERSNASLALHQNDAHHDLCRGYVFELCFAEDFSEDSIEAVHIGGHTPGFTMYLFEDVLLLCDYIFYNGKRAKFNPYGPVTPTRKGGGDIQAFLQQRDVRLVCGFDYVADIADWRPKFAELLAGDVMASRRPDSALK